MTNTSTFASQKASIPIQTSLAYRIPCYQRFQWLNSDIVTNVLARFLKPNTKGRKGYDKIQMFQWLMYKQFTRCTYRDLESMTDIDYSTFIKFRKRLALKAWFEKTFKKLIEQVVAGQDVLLPIVDSSFVESFSKGKGNERGQEYSGYKEKTGYKLHQIIDFETRLPLKLKTTGGARSDVVLGRNLVRGAPKYWSKKVTAFLADRGYDAEDFVLQIKRKWKDCDIGIPFRMMPQQTLTEEGYRQTKSLNRCLKPKLLNKRTEIERYFSRKKNVFHLGEEKTRHLENFNANCHFTAIMEILEWLSKDGHLMVLFTRLLHMIHPAD
jgi:hypothetical protein